MKKSTKIIVGVTAVAGISSAITAVAMTSIKYMKYFDMNQLAWKGGPSLHDLVKKSDDKINASKSLMDQVKTTSSFYLYTAEQLGTVEFQKMNFKYDINKKIKESKKAQTTSERKKEIKKEIKEINKKLKKLEDGLTFDDYSDDDFSSNYPDIDLPMKKIQENQEKKFKDEKNAFVNQSKTEEEGDKSWINEMKKKYGGATNEKEAITYLIYNEIKNKSFASNQYFLNDKYTVEQKKAKDKKGNIIYTFLKNVKINEKHQKDEDKIYFISSNSKNPTYIYADPTNPKILTKLTKANLVGLSHVLIPAKQNEKGPTLPWDITKEAIMGKNNTKDKQDGYLGLLGFYIDKDGKQQQYYKNIDSLFQKPVLSKYDKLFVENAVNQPSKDKDGSLGIDSKDKVLQDLNPGFRLGMSAALAKDSKISANGLTVLQNIKSGLDKFMKEHKNITNQSSLTNTINDMPKDDFSKKFGIIFRDAFNKEGEEYGSPNLCYQIKGTNTFIVLSKDGIHIVKSKDYTDKKIIKEQIKDDLANASKNQNTKKVKINYKKLFQTISTDTYIIEQLMQDNIFIKYIKSGYIKDKDKKNYGDLPDQKKNTLNVKVEQKAKWETVKIRINATIKNNDNYKKYKEIKKLLGDNLKWLLSRYDLKLTVSTITQQDIYSDIKKIIENKK